MEILLAPFYVIFGGLLNRFRGGGFYQTGHTQLARGIYSLLFALMAWLHTGNMWLALCIVPALFIGVLAPNDWGRVRDLAEAWRGVQSGIMNTALAALAALCFGEFYMAGALLIVGLLKGPIYYVAVRIPSRIPQFQGGEMGEFLYGCALGIAFGVA